MAETSAGMSTALFSIGLDVNILGQNIGPFGGDATQQISSALESSSLKIATFGMSSLPQAFALFQQIPGLFGGGGATNLGLFKAPKISLFAGKG